MKKVRILLAVAMLVAVAGGTLAFKAQKFGAYKLFVYDETSGSCIFSRAVASTGIDNIPSATFNQNTTTDPIPGNLCQQAVDVTLE
jgi:hypothetical protein